MSNSEFHLMPIVGTIVHGIAYEVFRLKRHWNWVGLIFPQANAIVSNTRSWRKLGF
jgi:hypothetical protein